MTPAPNQFLRSGGRIRNESISTLETTSRDSESRRGTGRGCSRMKRAQFRGSPSCRRDLMARGFGAVLRLHPGLRPTTTDHRFSRVVCS